jgi:hypothetical protein
MRMRLLISMWLGCAMVGMVWAASSPSVADEAVSVLASIEISTGQPEPGPLRLVGSRDRRQLIATAVSAAAHDLDVTAAVSWRVEPETLAVIEPGGMLIPLADGEGRVIAAAAGAGEVAVPLIVERVATIRRASP